MHQSCKLLFFAQTLTFGKRIQCFLFHTHLQLSPPILCSRFKFPVIVCEYILRAVSGRADYTLTSHLYNLGHLNNYNAKSWPILSQRQLSSPYKRIYQMFTRKKMAGLYCGRFERRGKRHSEVISFHDENPSIGLFGLPDWVELLIWVSLPDLHLFLNSCETAGCCKPCRLMENRTNWGIHWLALIAKIVWLIISRLCWGP